MNRVRVKIHEDTHSVIRRLYSKNINIYKIEYNKNGNIYTLDFSDLESVPFDFSIEEYSGIKKLLYSIRLNKHFIISVIISIMMIFLSSYVIVDIDVIHNDKKVREIITDELRLYGIYPLIIKRSYKEIQEIKEKIKNDYKDDIEWLEIIDDGMRYTVRVEERIITKREEKPEFCDVISNKEAIVISSKVSSGSLLVSQNDLVKKDTVLISGEIKFNDSIKSYTCAEGEVYGNTWYTVSVSVPYEHIEKDYTGNTHKNISLEFGSKRTPIFKTHYEHYDTDRKKIFSLGMFTIYYETDREYIENKEKYTTDEAEKIAHDLGREKILQNIPSTASILSEKVLQTNRYDSIIEMDLFYSVKEIIGVTVIRDKNPLEGEKYETTE